MKDHLKCTALPLTAPNELELKCIICFHMCWLCYGSICMHWLLNDSSFSPILYIFNFQLSFPLWLISLIVFMNLPFYFLALTETYDKNFLLPTLPQLWIAYTYSLNLLLSFTLHSLYTMCLHCLRTFWIVITWYTYFTFYNLYPFLLYFICQAAHLCLILPFRYIKFPES